MALINTAKKESDWLDGMAALDAKYPGAGFARERRALEMVWSGEKPAVATVTSRQHGIFDDTQQMINDFNRELGDRKTAAAGDRDNAPF